MKTTDRKYRLYIFFASYISKINIITGFEGMKAIYLIDYRLAGEHIVKSRHARGDAKAGDGPCRLGSLAQA